MSGQSLTTKGFVAFCECVAKMALDARDRARAACPHVMERTRETHFEGEFGGYSGEVGEDWHCRECGKYEYRTRFKPR